MCTCAPVRSYTCSCFFWDCHLNSNKCITLTKTYCICRDNSRWANVIQICYTYTIGYISIDKQSLLILSIIIYVIVKLSQWSDQVLVHCMVFFIQWVARVHNSQWQWQCCQSFCHLCWRCHCPPAESVQWYMQWCTRDCRGAELSREVVSCAAPLSCPSPSCEAGLLPPSTQGEETVSKHVQKRRDHQEKRRRRRRERRCRLTQPTCPLRWATSHKRASTSMCQVEVADNLCI